MTRVLAITVLETCLDSSVIRAYDLDEPLCEPIMRRVASGGRLQFFPHFPRPYFRVDTARTWVLQGVFGETRLRATFSPSAPAEAPARLTRLLEGGSDAPDGGGE
jgi:hypothetical protein